MCKGDRLAGDSRGQLYQASHLRQGEEDGRTILKLVHLIDRSTNEHVVDPLINSKPVKAPKPVRNMLEVSIAHLVLSIPGS